MSSQSSSTISLTDSEDSDQNSVTAANEEVDISNAAKSLENRINSLRTALQSLLVDVRKEHVLWKKEMQETLALENDIKRYANNEVSYIVSNNGDCQNIDIISNVIVRKDAVSNAKMQLEMEKYKNKLNEVDNLCQIEELRIRSSVHELTPLKMIADEWRKKDTPDN